MKKLFWIVVIAAIAYFTKPEKTELYEQALRQEFDMGTEFLPKVKMRLMEGKYDYNDYLVCNVLRDKKEQNAYYLGLFTKVFQIQEPPKEIDINLNDEE
jgi:hypothetical protein